VSPVIERITRPTVTGDGRKAPALRFGDLRVQALAGAIAAMLFTVTGITNKTLRGLMTGLLNRPYSMNQASYDLSRLARNGLIERVPGRNRYTLTRDGLLFAHIYTKVYDHVLRPLMAPGQPNAPPELAAALDTLDRLAASHIASARVPTAA
jgi:predicted transcriptional regulator